MRFASSRYDVCESKYRNLNVRQFLFRAGTIDRQDAIDYTFLINRRYLVNHVMRA